MAAPPLRTIDPPPAARAALAPARAKPETVPPVVDDDALATILRSGRPEGEPGVLEVAGVVCPTVARGHGSPILCIHGLGHDAWDWGPFFARCTNSQARVIALDLPGFGLADKPEGAPWRLQLLVDAVIAAAEQASAASPSHELPVVVASSLGGHVAILASLQRPELFRKLFLVSPGGLVAAPAPMQTLLRAYYSIDAIARRPEAELMSNSRKIFAAHGLPVDDALAARKLAVRRSSRAREFAVPFSGYVDDVFNHVMTDRLTQLRVPCAILVGARDVVVSPDACAAAARRIACRFHLLPDVGHCPHLEAPDAFADAALSFALS